MTFRLPAAESDPIFAVAAQAAKAGLGALNASIGMILDESGAPLVMQSVSDATQHTLTSSVNEGFPYPPLLGLTQFTSSVTALIFGSQEPLACAACAGGTGALALNLKLLKLLGIRNVVVPDPTWPNHIRLLKGFEMSPVLVPYTVQGVPSVEPILAALCSSPEPMGILLQTSCHNPTGKCLPRTEWQKLAVALSRSEHVALLDCAYQGLGAGIDADVESVRVLKAARLSFLVSWSASKNHGLYGLRTGLACAVTDDASRENVQRHYMILLRELHSAAPTIGQSIVTFVQQERRAAWESELSSIRDGLRARRDLLTHAFPSWHAVLDGEGLFAVLPLSTAHVLKLREKHVFLTADGRINLAGIPHSRMEEFIHVMHSVL